MKKLLLFALSLVILVSACTGKTATPTGSSVSEQPVDYSPVVQTQDTQIITSDVPPDSTPSESPPQPEPAPQATGQLHGFALDKNVAGWGDDIVVSYSVTNNQSGGAEYNVLVQMFDGNTGNDTRVLSIQEEGVSLVLNETKHLENAFTVTGSAFDRGKTYYAHIGLFDKDWKLLEWYAEFANFTVA